MKFSKKRISSLLESSKIALNVAMTDEEIKNALSDKELISNLSRYAITKEILEAGQQLIINVEEAKVRHNIEMGEAQQTTKLRNEAIDDLDFYITELFTASEYSLTDKPQHLEKMGITAYTEGYKRKRKKDNEEETEDQTG